MSDTVLAAIVGAVAGIITGSISSLFAPWANWGIEKKKQKLAYRRELVKGWRAFITRLYKFKAPEDYEGPVILLKHVVAREPEWATLRPYLSDDMRQAIEMDWNTTHESLKSSDLFENLTDEVGRIEKDWELV